MKVTEHIKSSKKTLFSFELLPPLKGQNFEEIKKSIDSLLEYDPAYINVTYHQEEVIYKKHEGGLLEKKTVRKRPGTVGIAAAIKFTFNVDVVPHIICGGFSMEETENALIDLHFLEIDNLFVVRGDPEKSQKHFIPESDGHEHSIDLVKQIINLNKGNYIDEDLLNTTPTKFCIGVAGYPEKHIEAPNMQTDISFLKCKVEEGAEYIVTQMFFDNRKYFDFVNLCRANGINVPIIPGLKPIAVKDHVTYLPKTFNIDVPFELVKEVEKCKDNKQARAVGIEWASMQAKELIKANVPVLHFYTMGKTDNIKKIAQNIF